ncbi:MAG: flagellar filament capping protein FliD [Candidatus Korobacteraceae bacterium]|jgi:flagellar hook-associated protein 2
MASFSTNYSAALGNILSQVNDAFSGKSTGIDVSSVVDSMMQVEDQPETQMKDEQSSLDAQISALTTIGSELSTLSNSVNSLGDFDGALNQFTTGSSDAAVVSAAAGDTATTGTHTVTVTNLATASSSYSGYLSAAALAGSEIDVKYGNPSNPTSTDTIDIPSTDTTLQQAASYINGGSYGVNASVVTDAGGSRLALTSKTSGVAGSLTVSSSATSFTSTAGVDAQLTVDGVPVDSGSNTVTGAIQGVTLSLGAADPGNPILITVEPDTTQAADAIESFVDSYNAVVDSINSQYTVNSSGSEGILAGDSMLQSLQSSLLDMVSTAVGNNGQYTNLESMGIEMQNDGTLQVDSTTLSDALSSSYSEVQNFFQSTSPAGWAETAGKEMTQLTDPTKGPVAADISGLTQSNTDLSSQISDFEANMTEVQQQLTSQYDTLDTLLIQYPMQMQEAAAQLASLPDATTSTSSSSSGL